MFPNSNGGGSNGGGSNGGGSNGGDSNGGDIVPLTNLSAFSGNVVSPVLMRGLWTTRGHLLLQHKPAATGTFAANSLVPRAPAPADADPEVRWYVCSSEFAEGLQWTMKGPAAPTASVTLTSRSASPARTFTLETPNRFDPSLTIDDQLRQVRALASYREERLAEINSQIVIPWSYFAMVLDLQPGKHRHTLELMRALFFNGKAAVLRMKSHFNVIRPVDLDSSILPIIATPAHSSYPAGHATEGTLVAQVVAGLVSHRKPGAAAMLETLADRIAENRIAAGLHYPVDNAAGKALGRWLADYVTKDLATRPGSVWQWLHANSASEW